MRQRGQAMFVPLVPGLSQARWDSVTAVFIVFIGLFSAVPRILRKKNLPDPLFSITYSHERAKFPGTNPTGVGNIHTSSYQ